MTDIIDTLKKVRRGAMFIIEAPSGTGKTSVIKKLMELDNNLKFSVSATTRKPREGEKDGVDYYYISDEKYDELMKIDLNEWKENVQRSRKFFKQFGSKLPKELDRFAKNLQKSIEAKL